MKIKFCPSKYLFNNSTVNFIAVEQILSASDPNFEGTTGFVNKTTVNTYLDYLSPRKDYKMKDASEIDRSGHFKRYYKLK